MLKDKINKLKRIFLEQSYLVENMIEKSLTGLLNKEIDVLNEIMVVDEPKVNEMEIKIEKMCIKLIGLYQPTGIDLREVLMIFKINNDLERMGDLAAKVAESAIYIAKRAPVKPLIDIPAMGKKCISMLKDSIRSFIDGDENLALQVIKEDDEIDKLHEQIFRELVTFMAADISTIERAMHLLRISKSFERIADLATNIGEDVIYVSDARIVKHGFSKDE